MGRNEGFYPHTRLAALVSLMRSLRSQGEGSERLSGFAAIYKLYLMRSMNKLAFSLREKVAGGRMRATKLQRMTVCKEA